MTSPAEVTTPSSRLRRVFLPSDGAPPWSKKLRFGWVLEGLAIAGVSFCYETLRNLVQGPAAAAMANAKALTTIEQWIGLYHERTVQGWFLGSPVVMGFWNFYYDTAHFFVPLFVAIYLYVQFPPRYVLIRNTFFILLLGIGQLAWLSLPINPPKWMPASYGFVDSQVKYYNVGPQKPLRYGPDGEPAADVIAQTGNPYGGLPSHHGSWALLCVLALWPIVRSRWAKGLLIGHVVLTIGAITVTGNHRFIDVPASVVELAFAYALALALQHALARRRQRRLREQPALLAS